MKRIASCRASSVSFPCFSHQGTASPGTSEIFFIDVEGGQSTSS